MSQAFVADTSLFIALESGRPIDAAALPSALAVSIVTIGELRAGVLAAADHEARHRRLRTLEGALHLQPLPIDEAVADAWALLRLRLRGLGRCMPVNDSWIAATALAPGFGVVTQDDDHNYCPGLSVIRL